VGSEKLQLSKEKAKKGWVAAGAETESEKALLRAEIAQMNQEVSADIMSEVWD